jgi:16S rRNA (cytosine1402-N4)-methyltransferase
MTFKHTSVLLEECIEGLHIKPDGIYVDGTLGGAGHSTEIVKRLVTGKLIGVDQDEAAIKTAEEKLDFAKDRVILVRDNFSQLENILEKLNIDKIDGVLLDLGVSSHQLDTPDRGFSYNYDAPLDMRMDNRSVKSAYEVINTYSVQKLHQVIRDYGEENWAKRIAEFIVEARKNGPIETTFQLVDIIKAAIPHKARMDGPHPAKRTFQAIRIEVNEELSIIANTIKAASKSLAVGGRICIISFHSLEDRIVKNAFRDLSVNCICPQEFPVCRCSNLAELKVITRKPIIPTVEELEGNPRSRSAKLRVAERI